MDTCEMCGMRKGTWHVLDENAEVMLCRPCVKELRTSGERVEAIR